MTDRWVVTGGAGYVGGHVVAAMRAAGPEIVVLDDLSTGRRDRLPADVPIVVGRVGDQTALDRVLPGAVGVVHLAALSSAPESLLRPAAYWRANVGDVATLLRGMVRHGVRQIVASSSAAVYGGGQPGPAGFAEDSSLRPLNPYGWTKLVGERLLGEVGGAADIAAICLRYFNVVGAGSPALADTKPAGLLAKVLEARRQGFPVSVNGRHHATPDGTAVRDYVHAADIADAHVAAVARLGAGWRGTAVYNLGTGR